MLPARSETCSCVSIVPIAQLDCHLYTCLQFVLEAVTDANFYGAIELWFNDRDVADATFGPMEDWDTCNVSIMNFAFCGRAGDCLAYFLAAQSFNHDISMRGRFGSDDDALHVLFCIVVQLRFIVVGCVVSDDDVRHFHRH